jgi:hypothetical protein
VGWVQALQLGEAETLSCRNGELEALVVIGGGTYIEAIGCVGLPRHSRCQVVICQCFVPYWGQGYCAEIKTTVDLLVG